MSDPTRHQPEEEPSTLALLGRTLRARFLVIVAAIVAVIGIRLVTEPGESQAWIIAVAVVLVIGVVTDRLRSTDLGERPERA